MLEKIAVFGAGGHAKVVIDAIEREGRYAIGLIVDADPMRAGSAVLGHLVSPEADGYAAISRGIRYAIVAIGANAARTRIAGLALEAGLTLVSVIHPAAIVAPTAEIGAGTLILAGCVVNADARIGRNVIVNTGAVIEHDCVVGEGVHVAPNTTLCGGVRIGNECLIGAGTTVVAGRSVGAGTVIGAGATVLTDIPAGVKAVGSPCRVLESLA